MKKRNNALEAHCGIWAHRCNDKIREGFWYTSFRSCKKAYILRYRWWNIVVSFHRYTPSCKKFHNVAYAHKYILPCIWSGIWGLRIVVAVVVVVVSVVVVSVVVVVAAAAAV